MISPRLLWFLFPRNPIVVVGASVTCELGSRRLFFLFEYLFFLTYYFIDVRHDRISMYYLL